MWWTSLGPELVTNGGFEVAEGDPFLADKADDPGTMTLATGSARPPGWVVNLGPVMWLRNDTTRWPWPLEAEEGRYFLDLTAFGTHLSGGVLQRIRAEPGRRYRVTLAIGTDAERPDTGVPAQIRVLFAAYFTNKVLGGAVFRRDTAPSGAGSWQIVSQDVVLDADAQEEADEALIAFIHDHFHTDGWNEDADADAGGPRWMYLQVSTDDLTADREKLGLPPSRYVAVDAVSVRQVLTPLQFLYGLGDRLVAFIRGGP